MSRTRTALLSVYHKDGIIDFAKRLQGLGWKLLASGGTAKHLKDAGVEVTDVATLVGKPILEHRVVTLSREIHAGLLATDTPEQNKELAENNIQRIDLVCVDLYPLVEEIKRNGSTVESVIEKTDIGGPTMLRSAAKGGRIVICDPADRIRVLEWLQSGEKEKDAFIEGLRAKAEFIVSEYCLASALCHGKGEYAGVLGTRSATCLYGENAWQGNTSLYSSNPDDPLAMQNFKLLEGTPPSYNNFADIDRLLQTITHIAAGLEVNGMKAKNPSIAVAVKHGNACGAAIGTNEADVLKNVIQGDKRAIMGGVVMTNFPLTHEGAEILATFESANGRRILDAVAAPEISPDAIADLRRKKDKCRFLMNKALLQLTEAALDRNPRFRYVRGGFLKQENYRFVLNLKNTAIINYSASPLSQEKEADIILAWGIGSTSTSNTITLVKNGMLLGNGVAQQDRVGAAQLAIKRAKDSGHDLKNVVAYSDSFFPFDDAPRELINAGITAILTTSGSVHDEDTIKLCKEKNISLLMIPDKLGRGFFGH